MKRMRGFIYCRVANNQMEATLEYQKDLLVELSSLLNIEVVAIAREISNGKHFYSQSMQQLLLYIRRKEIDVVLINDETRISIFKDLYEEFFMFCQMYEVEILTVSDLTMLLDEE